MLSRCAVLLALGFIISCGSGGDHTTAPAPVFAPAKPSVASVTVAPAAASLDVGSAQQLSAEVRDATGSLLSDRRVDWQSNDSSVAVVTPTGSVVGVSTGTAAISASSEGKSGAAQVTVRVAVTAIESMPFGPGDTVKVRGRGLRSATLTLSGSRVEQLLDTDTLLSFAAPDNLPVCDSPLPRLVLRIAKSGTTRDTTLATLGAPLRAPDRVGDDLVLTSVSTAGCRLSLNAGTYAIALFRVIASKPSSFTSWPNPNWPYPQDTIRQDILVRLSQPRGLRAGAPTTDAGAVTPWQPDMRTAVSAQASESDVRQLHSVRRNAVTQHQTACKRAPLFVGDTVRLHDDGLLKTNSDTAGSVYRVLLSSAHAQWLVFPPDLDSISPTARAQLASLGAEAEAKVFPFLLRTFGALPDLDGDGKLNIVLRYGLFSSAAYGFSNRYASSACPDGDFIWINLWQGTAAGYVDSDFFMTEATHESTHWVDLTGLVPYDQKPPWSIEGFAEFVVNLWRGDQAGLDYWSANARGGSPLLSGHICLFWAGRLGWPAFRFAPSYGYNYGCAILRYLSEQAIRDGASSALVARLLLQRRGWGDLSSVFSALGGRGRTEQELVGEALLMHYADDYVPGVSTRLINGTANWRPDWLVPAFGPYPYPLATVSFPSLSSFIAPLSLPDGFVVEVNLASPAVLSFGRIVADGGLAILRVR